MTSNTNGQPSADPSIEPRILSDRVDLLFEASPPSLLISLLVAVLFAAVHVHYTANLSYLPWLIGMTTILALRWWLVKSFRSKRTTRSDQSWLTWARAGSSLTAIMWSTGGLLFHQELHGSLDTFTLLVIAALTAAAQTTLGADFRSYLYFVLLALSPLALMELAHESFINTTTGVMLLMLIAFLLMSARRNADTLVHTLTLRHQNKALLSALEQEKTQVVQHARAMISELVAHAPVSVWATDADSVVNYVSSHDETSHSPLQQPALGVRLTDAFAPKATMLEHLIKALNGEQQTFEAVCNQAIVQAHLMPQWDEQQQPTGLIGVVIDISEHKQNQQELAYRANYDSLTGLANRSRAMEEIENAFARAQRENTLVAMLFIDLDNFKTINDTMGHQAGDELLQQTAQRLLKSTRDCDFVARISGDEFMVLTEGLQQPGHAESIAYKLTACFRPPFLLDKREVYATGSIGVALYPSDSQNVGDLMQCADTAMYHAKNQGKNSYAFFTHEMQAEAERNHVIERELRLALDKQELHLFYQPKVDAKTREIRGAEVLLRWQSEELGTVSPHEFIPIAELAGLMPKIGQWILQTACREAATWFDLCDREIQVAINISPQQFRKTDLLANVTEAVVNYGLQTGNVELEITESLLVQDCEKVKTTLEALNNLGIKLALDDFGTGYSSLSYLQKFPLQVLKIDKSFVDGIGVKKESESLVTTIIAMARSLEMEVVAEGVETAEQYAYLAERDVDLIQGYFFSRPLPPEKFRALLENGAKFD